MFTRAQALALGATDAMIKRRVAAGRWIRVYQGVFQIAGSPATRQQSLAAAVLVTGGDAKASHRSAAWLWRLPGFEPGTAEVSTTSAHPRIRPGIIVHRVLPMSPADVSRIEGIPVTAPARTILDLASVVAKPLVAGAMDDAIRRRLTSLSRIRSRMSALGRRPGFAVVRALVREREIVGAVPDSYLESLVLEALFDAGIRPKACQYEIWDAPGLIARVDFAWPDRKVAVEADSFGFHADVRAFRKDRSRWRALAALGWVVLPITWWDLERRPAEAMNSVRRALGGRGGTEDDTNRRSAVRQARRTR